MSKMNRVFLSLLSLIVLSFVSCNNLTSVDIEENDCSLVHFSIAEYETSQRTILPSSADKENLCFTLWGIKPGESEAKILNTKTGTSVDHMSYNDFSTAAFLLAKGTWTFTLEGFRQPADEAAVISGSATAEIPLESSQNISFTMTPVESGDGSINVSLAYELGTESYVSKITATLRAIDSEGSIATTPSAEDTWIINGENNSSCIGEPSYASGDSGSGNFNYTKTIAKGTYLLNFEVTSTHKTSGTTQFGYRSDVVIVAAYSESKPNAYLELKLRQVYSITYEGMTSDNGQTSYWTSGYPLDLDKYYSPYEEKELPKTGMSRNDAAFVGWYADENYSTAVTKIPVNTTGAQTFYARWRGNTRFVSADGTNDADHGDTATHAYKTVTYALSQLNNSNLDWTISVVGDITESISIDSATTAKSVTIEGYGGENVASITAGSDSVLKVSIQDVSVTVRHIKLIGGAGTDLGGGVTGGGVICIKDSNVSVTLEDGAEITGGSAKQGGGIYVNAGKITLNGGSIYENGLTGTELGSGVYVGSSGNFTFYSGTISNNGSTSTTFGGGIYSEGALTISKEDTSLETSRIVSGNTANAGAGIYSSGSLTVEHTTISGNTATNGSGGGIYTSGTTDTLTNTTITSNSASVSGGGIYTSGKLTLTSSTVGASDAANTAVTGGGIYNTGDLTVTGTQTASSTINYNTASANSEAGAGIFNESILTLQGNSGVSNNTAENGNGGGIYNAGSFTMQTANDYNPNVTSNEAVNGAGVYSDGNTATFKMSAGSIASNTASTSGGGVYNNGKMLMNGHAFIGNKTSIRAKIDTCSNKVIITKADGREVASGNGGGIYNTGKLYIGYTSESVPDNSFDGGIYQNYAKNGGGVYSESGAVYMCNGVINCNTVTVNGGGLYNGNSFEFSGGSFDYNNAASGGGIYNNKTMTVTGSSVVGSKPETSNPANEDSCSNKAEAYGGGIYNNTSGTLTLSADNSKFGGVYFNYANVDGGGIYNAAQTNVTITSGFVLQNGVVEGDDKYAGVSGGADVGENATVQDN